MWTLASGVGFLVGYQGIVRGASGIGIGDAPEMEVASCWS